MGIFEKPARKFFSREEGERIVAAIREAESDTSGEIRVHLENRCLHVDAPTRAADLFRSLKMDKTDLRNGILIYMAVKDNEFGLYADEGINQAVPEGYWQEIAAGMEASFRAEEFVPGLTSGILAIGQKLKTYFPGSPNDENELPDEISYGE